MGAAGAAGCGNDVCMPTAIGLCVDGGAPVEAGASHRTDARLPEAGVRDGGKDAKAD